MSNEINVIVRRTERYETVQNSERPSRAITRLRKIIRSSRVYEINEPLAVARNIERILETRK